MGFLPKYAGTQSSDMFVIESYREEKINLIEENEYLLWFKDCECLNVFGRSGSTDSLHIF